MVYITLLFHDITRQLVTLLELKKEVRYCDVPCIYFSFLDEQVIVPLLLSFLLFLFYMRQHLSRNKKHLDYA